MAQIKSFETFLNEGLTNQYLNTVNEGFESDSFTYTTKGSTISPLNYANAFTTAVIDGKLTKALIPSWITGYAPITEGQSAQQVYSALMASPTLTEIDAILMAKAKKSETAEELTKWKMDPEKQLLYAMLLIDLNSNNRDDWRNALGKNRTSVVVADIETKKKITQPGSASNQPAKSDKPNATEVPFTYTQDGSKGDVFVVNEWILSDAFKAALNARIQDIKETVDLLNPPAGKPKAFCPAISIESSCSTAPNGTPKSSPGAEKYAGQPISFMNLSKERANAVLNYIKAGLTSVGVLVDADTKISIKADGQNGDGTSGPAWNTVQGADNATKLAQVKPYQMAKVDFVILFNDTTALVTPSVETKPEGEVVPPQIVEVPAGEYKLTMSIRTFRFKLPSINLPRINIRLPKLGGGRRNWGSTKCFKF